MTEYQSLPSPHEPIRFGRPLGKRTRRILAFLICCSVLVAAFAVSRLWEGRGSHGLWGSGGQESPSETAPPSDGTVGTEPTPEPSPELSRPSIPEGALPVVAMDLSCSAMGKDYFFNETCYRPDPAALRAGLQLPAFPVGEAPVVLILHTHASEAYLPEGSAYIEGELGDISHSEDATRNVLAVGEALCRRLNQNGVPTLQCRELHGIAGSLRGSYEGAADCIAAYLAQYPSIRYVIDLHRDGILDASGNCVRTLAGGGESPMAQVMAVVGSDGNGTASPHWQSNLALALGLYDGLQESCQTLTRPISLRNASYNQELAARSLLLEIGSSGNSVSEAVRTAEAVGDVLARMIRQVG